MEQLVNKACALARHVLAHAFGPERQAWSLQQAVEAALQSVAQATHLEQRPEGRL